MAKDIVYAKETIVHAAELIRYVVFGALHIAPRASESIEDAVAQAEVTYGSGSLIADAIEDADVMSTQVESGVAGEGTMSTQVESAVAGEGTTSTQVEPAVAGEGAVSTQVELTEADLRSNLGNLLQGLATVAIASSV